MTSFVPSTTMNLLTIFRTCKAIQLNAYVLQTRILFQQFIYGSFNFFRIGLLTVTIIIPLQYYRFLRFFRFRRNGCCVTESVLSFVALLSWEAVPCCPHPANIVHTIAVVSSVLKICLFFI